MPGLYTPKTAMTRPMITKVQPMLTRLINPNHIMATVAIQ